MLDTESLITKIREYLQENTSLEKVYSPDLPHEKNNIACVTILGGIPYNNLKEFSDADITLRVLIRGNKNDAISRKLSDEVFNILHLKQNLPFGNQKVVFFVATTTPMYVGKDENDNNLYNITFRLKIC